MDDRIVEVFKSIRKMCANNQTCKDCPFFFEENKHINHMGCDFSHLPDMWNIEKWDLKNISPSD